MFQRIKNYFHLLQAVLTVRKYDYPASDMVVVGVTGTDGKTTTASLIYHILATAGYKVALISTVAAYIGGKKYDTGLHTSTPDSSVLQAYISKAKKLGTTHLVLEVTSHALDQRRVHGIQFEVGILTNVTHEHLDYHHTMDNYLAAKAKLLLSSRVAVINRDDSSFTYMSQRLGGKKVVSYGLHSNADVNPSNHRYKTSLPGEFNQSNILAALAASDVLGIDPTESLNAVSTFKLPEGRMDTVYDKNFKIIIDFAHTPNSLQNILSTIKSESSGGRIIHVFGSAGKRDTDKRPLMGKTSSGFADIIILTSEDTRGEPFAKISEEIRSGITSKKVEVLVIESRQDAITQAVRLAKKGDVVIVTGKGHEKSMNLGHKEESWSDYKAVEEALRKM